MIKFFKIFTTVFLFKLLLIINLFGTEIIIFHTNDVHGRAEETKTTIGYAKMATIIENTRKTNKNVLFLDAGDAFHGTLLANLTKGKSIVDILNTMKLDALTTGNHDYNYGLKELNRLNGRADFIILAANVIDNKGNRVFQDHMIRKFENIRIGIFGIATPETKFKTHPMNVANLTFLDPKKTAEEQVAILKSKGADLIIALVHLGIDETTPLTERSSYLSTVNGLDLIIDGHSHTLLPKGERIQNTIITQTGFYGEHLGKIIINIENDKKTINPTVINIEDTLSTLSDKKILKIIDKYNKKNEKITKKEITTLAIDLEGKREIVRQKETNLGMLITDAMKDITNSDVAFLNGGGIRSSIYKGNVLYKDVLNTLPFSNSIVVLEVSGKIINEALEKSAASLPNVSGGFLHVSGITFDLNLNKKPLSRISNVKVNGMALDKNKTYKLALPDFLAAGGDGYLMFKNIPVSLISVTLDDATVKYMEKTNLNEYNFANKITVIATQ